MNNMDENHKITTVEELLKYKGKIIVTHYKYTHFGYTSSLRILTDIKHSEGRQTLMGCHVYGKYILKIKENGTHMGHFLCEEDSKYSSEVEYVTLPTTEEKHMFMELYTKRKLEESKIYRK